MQKKQQTRDALDLFLNKIWMGYNVKLFENASQKMFTIVRTPRIRLGDVPGIRRWEEPRLRHRGTLQLVHLERYLWASR